MTTALTPLTATHLEAVAHIEQTAQAYPWSRRHFESSLQAGHGLWALTQTLDPAMVQTAAPEAAPTLPDGRALLAYLVGLDAADEIHLLHLATVPSQRRLGHARRLLLAWIERARARGASTLWLEVRQSNVAAQRLYTSLGCQTTGVRKGYYPTQTAQREDAWVMCLPLTTSPP